MKPPSVSFSLLHVVSSEAPCHVCDILSDRKENLCIFPENPDHCLSRVLLSVAFSPRHR